MTSLRRVVAFLGATLLTTIALAQQKAVVPPPNLAEIQKQVTTDVDTGVQTAKQRIRSAINVCMHSACNDTTLAKLYLLLAHVLIVGNSPLEARSAVIEALQHEPDATPDASFDSRELEALIVEARESTVPPSNFDFTAPLELQKGVPFAAYLEYHGLGEVRRVVLYYKTQASPAFTSVVMSTLGSGFGVMLNCDRLKDATKLRYYFEGVNGDGAVVARGGRSDFPYVVPIHTQVSTPLPHFPGLSTPRPCDEVREPSASRVGMTCDDDLECGALRCVRGKCRSAADEPVVHHAIVETPVANQLLPNGEACVYSTACESGRCEGVCLPKRKLLRVWLGVGGDYSFSVMPSMEDACNTTTSGVPDHAGVRCFRSDNGRPMPYNGTESIVLRSGGDAGTVGGRVTAGNARMWLSADIALNGQIMVGIRLGFVGMRDDYIEKPFPFHLEARLTALLFKDALYDERTAPIWSPYAFVSFGTSRATANVYTTVLYGADRVPVDVSYLSGAGYFAVGGGLKVNILSSRHVALFAAPLKMSVTFGSTSVLSVLEPELAIVTAF